MEYEIKFHPEALKEFCALDGSIKVLVKKQLEKLKKRADKLALQYHLDFAHMVHSIKSRHQHNGKVLQFTPA